MDLRTKLRSQSLFYWIIYSYKSQISIQTHQMKLVSILILLDYLFLWGFTFKPKRYESNRSQSLFYWIIYSYTMSDFTKYCWEILSQSLFYWIIYSYNSANGSYLFINDSLNPYFIGLSILIFPKWKGRKVLSKSQSLFYWIIYSYPFCRESPLFIIATEFFSDIKIDFFLIFLVFFF